MFDKECAICDGQKESGDLICRDHYPLDIDNVVQELVKKVNRLKEYEEHLIEKLVEYQEKFENGKV